MKQTSISEPGWSHMILGTLSSAHKSTFPLYHQDRATHGTKCDIPLAELNTLLLNVLWSFDKNLDETKVE